MTSKGPHPYMRLAPGWDVAPLEDLTTKIGSGATPRGGKNSYVEEGVHLIRSQNVHDLRFSVDGLACITDDAADKLAGVEVRAGDVLLNITGASIARCCQAPQWVLPARVNQHVAIVRPSERLDARFLMYLLVHPEMRAYVLSHNAGASREAITKRHIEGLLVPVPPIEEQRAIAEVLGALDDRIEWCGRAAALLHEFTRAAFQVWVADEGDERSVYEVAAVEYGAPYASAKFNDRREGLPVIRIRDITADDAGMYTTERHPRDVVIEPGDIVVGMDGEFRAHAWRGPRGLLNQRVCCFRPNEGVARTLVLHGLEAPLRFYEGSITGTTVIHLGKRHIDRFTVPFSPAGNEMMVRVADPMLERAVTLASEQRQLAAIRDSLLPRLLSGEVRIQDPARMLGAVA
ncbi:MAG: restriction endonuclease subunit S [Acidimicrobiia bacterium]